jgi:hypothetical protein
MAREGHGVCQAIHVAAWLCPALLLGGLGAGCEPRVQRRPRPAGVGDEATAPGRVQARPGVRRPAAPEAPVDPGEDFGDLDGDGHGERLEEVADSCGTGGCVYDLWQVTRGHVRHLGRVDGRFRRTRLLPDTLHPGKLRSRGFLDILSTWDLGCCHQVRLHYRYDGTRYRRFREQECLLSSDTSTWTCGEWRSAPP